QDYEAALFAVEEILAVASPAYLEKLGEVNSVGDLKRARLIHLDEPIRPRPTWKDWFDAMGVAFEEKGEGLRLNDYALVLQAAMEGEGLAMGWRHVVDRLLRSGMLQTALPESFKSGKGFYLLWAKRRPLSADALAVRDWLLQRI
ncbi:MAG: LysR substrate-binding domain-containing protein, partial [Kiloniellales bacterium]|nr:LysR substrate-binding domain-containing protein [Kiloniellales bacterium]